MGVRKTFLNCFGFCMLSILCILSNFTKADGSSVGQSSPGAIPASTPTDLVSSEEEIAPLPPVGKKYPEAPASESKNKQNGQNGRVADPIPSPPYASPCCPSDPCRPGPLKLFIRHMVADWRENNCWPNGLPEPDRQQVLSTLETQIQNGWRRQNLLSDFHFEPETGQLNSAGEEKLRWILWEVPEKHRIVYVARSIHPSETEARMASVQKAAAQMMGDRPLPPILPSELSPIGWPSAQVDAIHRKFQETMPPPRLKAPTNPGSSNP